MSKVIEGKPEAGVQEGRRRDAKKSGAIRVALVQSKSDLGTETMTFVTQILNRPYRTSRKPRTPMRTLLCLERCTSLGIARTNGCTNGPPSSTHPDMHVKKLIEAASRHGVHIIMGMGTFGAAMPGDVYNTALLVGPTGLVGAYRKTHVAAFPYSEGISMERRFYSPGKDLPVFDTALGSIGIHICYDMSFPEIARVQALKGADFFVNVSASAGGFGQFWEHGMFMRAVENCTWYMVCSVVGMQRGDRLFGGSRIVDPGGNVIAHGKFDAEDFVIADVEQQRAARSTSHLFNIRQPEIYKAISEPSSNP